MAFRSRSATRFSKCRFISMMASAKNPARSSGGRSWLTAYMSAPNFFKSGIFHRRNLMRSPLFALRTFPSIDRHASGVGSLSLTAYYARHARVSSAIRHAGVRRVSGAGRHALSRRVSLGIRHAIGGPGLYLRSARFVSTGFYSWPAR